MRKTIIITEEMAKRLTADLMLTENTITKDEIGKIVASSLKNDSTVKKTLEKEVKNIVADSVNMLFKTLWQRRNFYEDEIRK